MIGEGSSFKSSVRAGLAVLDSVARDAWSRVKRSCAAPALGVIVVEWRLRVCPPMGRRVDVGFVTDRFKSIYNRRPKPLSYARANGPVSDRLKKKLIQTGASNA